MIGVEGKSGAEVKRGSVMVGADAACYVSGTLISGLQTTKVRTARRRRSSMANISTNELGFVPSPSQNRRELRSLGPSRAVGWRRCQRDFV